MLQKMYCCLLITFFTTAVSAQNSEADYLKQNKNEVDLSSKDCFLFFPKDFYNNQIFLFGENHGSAQPHEFDVAFFKHLYHKEKLRFYIAEVDPIKAWMLNSYLKDGNAAWLEKVFKSWKNEGAQWASESNWNKFKQLHLFYKSLPKREKFTIIGIDVIQDYSLLSEYVQFLIKQKTSGIDALNQLMQTADTLDYKNRKIMGNLARKILSDLNSNLNYKKELTTNFIDFELLIKNAGYVGNGMPRDSIMFTTFLDHADALKLQHTKLYGFLGFFHTLQISYEKAMPFAAHLKSRSIYNKIASLQMFAIDCKVLLPYNNQVKTMMPASFVEQLRKENPDFPITDKFIPYKLSNDDMMMKVNGIEDAKKVSSPNAITIFTLNNANTPFSKTKKLGEVTGFQSVKMTSSNSVTTDAFQYIVLFRNSPAAIPLK